MLELSLCIPKLLKGTVPLKDMELLLDDPNTVIIATPLSIMQYAPDSIMKISVFNRLNMLICRFISLQLYLFLI